MININQIELEILKNWQKTKTFEKSLEKTKSKKKYVFYDGPPFATGLPHYGHILASTIKDAIPRFWTMKGFYVRRVWGWDCHGLPIENIAEQELGIKTKDQIEKIGIKKFNDFCKRKVLTYASEWKKTIDRMARWIEFDNSYKTMDNTYIESVLWAFKEFYKKDLIYEGEKVLMYCPRCETPIAKAEISMDNSYKTVKEDTITVKFKLADENAYILAWTTTPWTLPSNLALAVNKKLDYAYVKDLSDNKVYILAKELILNYFKEKKYKILKTVKGKELVGKTYEPLFPYFKNLKNSFRVIAGDFVSVEDGTGIVHTAPAFGEEDYNVCKKKGIGFIQPVDKSGRFTKEIVDFKGMKVFDANPKIIDFLKQQGKIIKVEKKSHEYPFCYRCETPLIYRAIPAWFVNIQKVKSKLLKFNQKINWHPGFLKDGRFKNNIESAPDWNISRNRYWATAIPIWKCDSCNGIKVIGSIQELKKESSKKITGKVDLHKDYLDKIKLKCKCGKDMPRIPEVMDCWFESGCMPFAQFHYPFENKKLFENNFPSQYVAEYIGQTRAWFYYMLVVSGILFNEEPFENVQTTGTILAEDGSKMSKSKGNFPDPWEIFEKYGVDSLRFYLLSSPLMNAENVNFSERSVEEIYKKVLLLMYNVNNFYSINRSEKKLAKLNSKNILDKWIISRTNELIKKVTDYMNSYNTIKACDEIKIFVDDLSTWYVRRSRERFNSHDKNAEATLEFVLDNLSKVCAPIMPFVSEKIYQTLHGEKESVHLQKWPNADVKKIDKKLILKMKIVREAVSAGLRARDQAKINLRWPLAKAIIYSGEHQAIKEMGEIIKEELNVRKVELRVDHKRELKAELDTNLTPELEAEGYARELSRKVQAFRKKLGLEKKDEIKLVIITDDEFKDILESQKIFMKERINSKDIDIVTTGKERFKNEFIFKIKDKRGRIAVVR